MYTFTSTYWDGIKISGIEDGISSKDMELLSWVCNAYGFLLPRKEKIDTKNMITYNTFSTRLSPNTQFNVIPLRN